MEQTRLDEIKALISKYETALAGVVGEDVKKAKRNLDRYSYSYITQLLAEIERLTAENSKLQEKQTAKMVDISDDGEKSCPVCNCEVVGYYAQYCEHCGQHLDYPEEE